MATIERARAIAESAHAGQVDKAGADYITQARIVALLHDVGEDSDWTLEGLRQEGFSDAVVNAVDALTHREDEDYFDAVRRARDNDLARTVKLADLADNSDRTRLGMVTEDDERRLRKYAEARAIILGDAT